MYSVYTEIELSDLIRVLMIIIFILIHTLRLNRSTIFKKVTFAANVTIEIRIDESFSVNDDPVSLNM